MTYFYQKNIMTMKNKYKQMIFLLLRRQVVNRLLGRLVMY